MSGVTSIKSNPFLMWNNLDDPTKVKKKYLKYAANRILENADYFFNLETAVQENNTTEAVKISRRKYPFLRRSYTVTRDLNTKEIQVFRHFHGKDDSGNKKGFIAAGAYKVVLEMKSEIGNNDAVRAQLIRKKVSESLKQLIKELPFSNYILIPKYMTWISEKTNLVKEALISEKMDQDISVYIENRKISSMQIKNIFWQIAKGVQEMHDKNWIHQDLKPENILIKGNTVKIADLDMVEKVVDGQDVTCIGSRLFKPPEVFFKIVSNINEAKKIDIYSLGGTFYEIYKREPFHIFFNHKIQWFIFDETERNNLFSEPENKKDLTYLIWRMTRFHPDERPTIEEVINFLK